MIRKQNNDVFSACKRAYKMPLDMAWKHLKSLGYTLHVASLDGTPREGHTVEEQDFTRVNVYVRDGIVVKSWVG